MLKFVLKYNGIALYAIAAFLSVCKLKREIVSREM